MACGLSSEKAPILSLKNPDAGRTLARWNELPPASGREMKQAGDGIGMKPVGKSSEQLILCQLDALPSCGTRLAHADATLVPIGRPTLENTSHK